MDSELARAYNNLADPHKPTCREMLMYLAPMLMCRNTIHKKLIDSSPLFRTFISKKMIPPMIFTLDDFKHIFRALLTAAF